jgi:SAM-dependent methyltransferase
VLHPGHDIRIEHFRDTRLPADRIDAVIGNVPFADLRLDYHGTRLALHDFFLAKSLDALKPGGVLALVTSHYTLDKQHPGVRQSLAQQADFLGAIRLPPEAFAQEGTRVVTDILCLRKRAAGEAPAHVDPAWLETAPLTLDGVVIPVNRYFLQHPAMVLGTWSHHDRLYGSEGYTLMATGDLAAQLAAALQHLPQGVYTAHPTAPAHPAAPPAPLPPLESHLTEGSFFVTESKALMQV